MISQQQKEKLKRIFEKNRAVLAYLFGSVVRNQAGPLSDIDIAVLFSDRIKKNRYFDERLKLAGQVDAVFKTTDKAEVVCLNEAPPLLKHRAVFGGILLFARNEKLAREFELATLREYEDFRYHLETSFRLMAKRIKDESFGRPLISPYRKTYGR